MKYVICIIISLPAALPLRAQYLLGVNNAAMNGSAVAYPDPDWALFMNPAGFVNAGRSSAGWFVMRHFGFRELTDVAVSLNTSVGKIPVSFGASGWGFDLYRETRFRGGSGWYNRDLRAGFALEYRSVSIAGYGKAGVMQVDAGIIAAISSDLSAGIVAINLTGSRLGKAHDPLPKILAVGITKEIAQKLMISASAWKDSAHPIDLRVGASIRVLNEMYLTAGTGTEPAFVGFGCRINLNRFSGGVVARHHPVLGRSEGIDSVLRW